MDENKSIPELIYHTVLPKSGLDFESQLLFCYDQLEKYIENQFEKEVTVIKQTLFVKAFNNNDFFNFKSKALNIYNSKFNKPIATTIVAQLPENDFMVSVEFVLLEDSSGINILEKRFKGNCYFILESGLSKIIFSGGISFDLQETDIKVQSNNSFEQIHEILKKEKGSFSDIIRQWNYIENITGSLGPKNNIEHNYQIFNNIRSEFYDSSDFKSGYPAASAIGMECGGVILEFVASIGKEFKATPISNPEQKDAYKYSSKSLSNNSKLNCGNTTTTPKFERAKLLLGNKRAYLFVSGTAAIKGEETFTGTLEEQVAVTLKNIDLLVSDANLQRNGVPEIYKNKILSGIRVYVKKSKDIKVVKEIVNEKHGCCAITFVKSDICRENLLVEIEAVFEFLY